MNWASLVCISSSIPLVLLIEERYNRTDVDNNYNNLDEQDDG